MGRGGCGGALHHIHLRGRIHTHTDRHTYTHTRRHVDLLFSLCVLLIARSRLTVVAQASSNWTAKSVPLYKYPIVPRSSVVIFLPVYAQVLVLAPKSGYAAKWQTGVYGVVAVRCAFPVFLTFAAHVHCCFAS